MKKFLFGLTLLACLMAGCSDSGSADAPPRMTQPIVTDDLNPKSTAVDNSDPKAAVTGNSEPGKADTDTSAVYPSQEQAAQPQPTTGADSTQAPPTTGADSTQTPPTTGADSTQTPPNIGYSGSHHASGHNSGSGQTWSHGTTHSGDYWQYCLYKAEKDALEIEIENLESAYRVGKLDKDSFQTQKSLLEAQKDTLDDNKERYEDSFHTHLESLPVKSGTKAEMEAWLEDMDQEEDALDEKEDELENDYLLGNLSREEFISRQAEIIYRDEQLDREKDYLKDLLDRMDD